MKNIKLHCRVMIGLFAGFWVLTSCSESWLEPKPLSFYTPENTYIDAAGFYSALATCERLMRHEYFGDGADILTEMILSDLAVEGTTDKAGPQMNIDVSLLPDANLNSVDRTKVGNYWKEGFNGVKYANVVITRIDDAKYKDEAERNGVLGTAYFHRAYHYYKLTHQFGDVPFLDGEVNTPQYNYYSHDRWSILKRLKSDMEFAYKWVPPTTVQGKTTHEACGVLLMKICMCLCEFDRAIEVGKEIVAKHPLMKNRFSSNKNKANTNLMHDLHSVEGKLDAANTEGLMYVMAYPEIEGSNTIQTMRNGVPYWESKAILTPDGKSGTAKFVASNEKDPALDNNANYGRGIGRLRPTSYYQYKIWRTGKEDTDLRGRYNRDSWKRMEDLYYNNPSLKGKSEWYGKHLVRPVNLSVNDSIRSWYSWPHYKLFVPDPLNTEKKGGETPWYIYRSAEVYLMLAECYYWTDQLGSAANALNEVRTRAGASPVTASEVTIGEILDERARELYYEEKRHVELTRVAYTYAKTGKACEVFGGRVYKMDNFSGPGGTGSNVKKEGYNFYYDWVITQNNFYNKGVVTKFAEYKLSVHHVLWPIPASAINSNVQGVINQNIGYPGAENNVKPLELPTESMVE
ncbi:RagB/SusD family nutrient uptake outer membrane protein [Parabacteroides pacaensis]|uniref:RagB/SusD family nutrient uptake outer membrane protein n=1 Tax=Parabacteroides pacaensis TaxID=2086575 RepID=UPI000D0F6D63|nr:RagB/SusD family nutrient uptake outer membrane protein [Parabacteroides pacaensis]